MGQYISFSTTTLMGNSIENSTARSQPTTNGITMYGQDWCPDCMRAHAAFSNLGVEFHYEDAGIGDPRIVAIQGKARRALGRSPNSIPCISFPDGSHLTTPSVAQIKEKLKQLGLLNTSASA